MTEEIIKECKNCDALGIDSEIGAYYCCLSHRQDDLPKEFTCDDYVPNKQLKRLEQERDEWKKKYEDVANENLKEIYELIKKNDCWREVVNVVCSKLEQENKELKKKVKELDKMTGIFSARLCDKYRSALEEIKNYLNTLSSVDSDFVNTETYLRIQNKINEVIDAK